MKNIWISAKTNCFTTSRAKKRLIVDLSIGLKYVLINYYTCFQFLFVTKTKWIFLQCFQTNNPLLVNLHSLNIISEGRNSSDSKQFLESGAQWLQIQTQATIGPSRVRVLHRYYHPREEQVDFLFAFLGIIMK